MTGWGQGRLGGVGQGGGQGGDGGAPESSAGATKVAPLKIQCTRTEK